MEIDTNCQNFSKAKVFNGVLLINLEYNLKIVTDQHGSDWKNL